jgi:hypothetical protein
MIDRSLLKSDDDDALSTRMATKNRSTQNKIYTREPGMNCSRVSRAGGSRKYYLSNANCFRRWFLLQDLARTEVTIPLDYCCRRDLSHFSRTEMIRIAATRLLVQQLHGMIDALSLSLSLSLWDSRLFEVRGPSTQNSSLLLQRSERNFLRPKKSVQERTVSKRKLLQSTTINITRHHHFLQ